MDLDMLSGIPRLKKLSCDGNRMLTGSLRSVATYCSKLAELCLTDCPLISGSLHDLGDLCHTLTSLYLEDCTEVTGALSSLRDFVHFIWMWLGNTKVVFDVHNLSPGDFPWLVKLEGMPRTKDEYEEMAAAFVTFPRAIICQNYEERLLLGLPPFK